MIALLSVIVNDVEDVFDPASGSRLTTGLRVATKFLAGKCGYCAK